MKSQSHQISAFGKAFINYGSYHFDTTYSLSYSSNKIIHIICIPLIAATLLSLLSFIPYSIELFGFSIGAAELLVLVGFAYHVSLNMFYGLFEGLYIFILSQIWKWAFSDYSNAQLYKLVVVVQIAAWVLQFIGHGVFQKRKPALMDNVTQILNAPMFVFVQLCEMLGLKTNELQLWKVQIKKNVLEYRQKSKKSQ